jgi:uncharacterized protein
MATLARLMQEHLPVMIEPEKYALSGEKLQGTVSIMELPGLSDLVQNREGKVNFELSFSRDSTAWLNATGTITARLILQCQRCLEAMTLEVHNTIHVAIVNTQQQVELLPDNIEPFLAVDKKISVNTLIAEELLLSLPLSPLHEEAECPAVHEIRTHRSHRESPFAVLKDIKKSNS